MSYRNPTQHIDRSLGRDVQQLQNTITSSFRAFGESYAKAQKEAAKTIKAETDRRTKLVTDLESKNLTLKKGFSGLKENNNSYDFQKILGNELDVYNEYATSLINKTISDPKEIAKRKHRMAEIEGIAGLIKDDLGIIGSFSEDMQSKMNTAGEFGGYYLGNKSKGLEYMQVLANNLKGARDVNLQWDDEKSSYNVNYVNTPEGGEPISVNSRDLRAGEVGAKEIVPIIPDPKENQKAALSASGFYKKVIGANGRETEVINDQYMLPGTEIIDDPNNKGSKIKVQYVNKEKFKNNLMETGASKAYIDGLDPDDREAFNNGALVKFGGEVVVPYSDNEEFNKKNDALVMKNYVEYQASRIPQYKVLQKIKPPSTEKPPTENQLDKAKSIELRAGAFAAALGTQESLEKALEKVNISDKRVITDTGDEEGKVLGYIAKKGDKEYRFMIGADEKETVKKMLQFDGKLSDNEINVQLEKLFPLGSEDPLNPNI